MSSDGTPVTLAWPTAKNAAERSSMIVRQRSAGSFSAAQVNGVEREPGLMTASVTPARASEPISRRAHSVSRLGGVTGRARSRGTRAQRACLSDGLVELGVGVGAGDDARACVHVHRGALDADAAQRDRELAVAVQVEPADGPRVPAAPEPLVLRDEVERDVARRARDGGRRMQRLGQLEHVLPGRDPPLERGDQVRDAPVLPDERLLRVLERERVRRERFVDREHDGQVLAPILFALLERRRVGVVGDRGARDRFGPHAIGALLDEPLGRCARPGHVAVAHDVAIRAVGAQQRARERLRVDLRGGAQPDGAREHDLRRRARVNGGERALDDGAPRGAIGGRREIAGEPRQRGVVRAR